MKKLSNTLCIFLSGIFIFITMVGLVIGLPYGCSLLMRHFVNIKVADPLGAFIGLAVEFGIFCVLFSRK